MSRNHIIVICLIFYIVLLVYFFKNSNNVSVTFLNIGQGDAALIKLGNFDYMLVDGGPDMSVDGTALRFITYPRCKIRAFYISHFHADHINGLPNIIARCVKSLSTFNDIYGYSYSEVAFTDLLSKNKFIDLPLNFSQTVQSGLIQLYPIVGKPDLRIYFLWPTEEVLKIKDENDRSLIMLVDFGSFEILFTGDASGDIIEKALTPRALSLIDGNLEIYKVPHHGSYTGRSQAVLNKLRPLHCVISVGKNSYGHPNKQVLADLTQVGCRIHRTDQEGNVEFKL